MKTYLALVLMFAGAAISGITAETPVYPATHFPDSSGWGRNVQRTMRLLATSTAEHRNTVRILFYGQSITEQKWASLVESDLRRRFPHANLIVENRALGGFASQMLVKTAETDLYPFQPDLLIFHVYGAHNTYEDIIRRTRERTTAEILIQTDHVTKPADFTEETDPAKLPPAGKHWDAFMNHNWLPSMAKKYGAELCDQRTLWKAYLKENNLEPKALLKDGVHLNTHGEWLMAECVKAYLRYDPKLGPSPAENQVKTFEIGRNVRWVDGKLRLDFEGSRIEVICKPGMAPPAAVRIDGRKPSEFPELYGFTRAVTVPPGKWPVKWPVIAPISSRQILLVEDWTLSAKREDAANDKLFSFVVAGSKTGMDGAGHSSERFVSKSGKVVIETNDWNVTYALSLGGIKPVPDAFEVKWKVEPRFVDEFVSPGATSTATETIVTLASGLPNAKHTLEISGSDATPVAAIRVYRPPLAVAASQTALLLFNGRDLSGWREPAGEWMVAGAVAMDLTNSRVMAITPGTGVLVNGAKGQTRNLISGEEFGDVELYVEFCIPRKSNSGVYLMGRYEIQIYDSYGVEKDQYPGIECGGIYPQWIQEKNRGGQSPRVNASKAPGEWQSFDITFRAPRFDGSGKKTANARFAKVLHNGVVIHENVEVDGPTRSSQWADEKPVGAIMIQGDHGPVAYRNLRARKLDAAE